MKAYKYLDIITGLFVAVLIVSNVASVKIVQLGFLAFDGGTLLFPLAYIFGDILTEVYGYARGRRVIWTGFLSLAVLSLVLSLVGRLPAAGDWPHQEAYNVILGQAPRIVLASLIAYFAGEFANSYTLARMKVFSHGRHLWLRAIVSTIIGQLLDTVVFVLIAFLGVLDGGLLFQVIWSNYLFKVGVEILFFPITFLVVRSLKKAENEDHYDVGTNFNPFRFSGR
jgi:hypothetical protein